MDCSIGRPLCETSDAPISDQWPDWWTSSLRVSRASPTASRAPGWEPTTPATSGRTPSEPLATWHPDGPCWRTCQASLLTGTAEPWSGSFPRSGMTAAGGLYPLRTLGHHTGATGGGALRIEQGYVPTPTASNRPNRSNARPRLSLEDVAQRGQPMFPTPAASDAERASTTYPKGNQTLEGAARELWPTPTVSGNNNRKGVSPNSGDGLATAAKRWPTPAARDAKDVGTEPSQWARHTPGLSIQVQQWPTPQSRDHRSGEAARIDRPQKNLNDVVANWPTPTAHDANGAAPTEYDRHSPNLAALANWPTPRASLTGGADSHGQMPAAFRGGLLNPRWVEWLQGIPIGWTETDELPQTNYTAWQTLSAMQDDLLPETETKREMGRDVQAPTLLRFQLCGICTWPEHARGRPETSAADDPANQLPMREYIQPSKTPHRRESSEQLGRQSGGALPEMSHGCPHEHRDMGSWWEVEPAIPRVIGGHPNRVNQVRTLGNGIVPAVVARFLRELMS